MCTWNCLESIRFWCCCYKKRNRLESVGWRIYPLTDDYYIYTLIDEIEDLNQQNKILTEI